MVPQNDPQDFRQIMSDYKTKVIHRGLLYLRTNISIVILARQFIWSNKLPSELLKSQQFTKKINCLPTQFTHSCRRFHKQFTCSSSCRQ